MLISITGDTFMVPNNQRSAYYSALLSENRMLVDYIAANAARNIAEICLKDTRPSFGEMTIGPILSRLDEISSALEHSTEATCTIAAEDAAFLQTLRDTLDRVVRPASSLTIAYTALVTGSRRSRNAESRTTLARDAFGGVISASFWHRWTQRGFLCLALLITLLAVRESSNVALGRAYMQNLVELHTRQASIALEKAQVEGLAKPIDDPDQLLDTTNGHPRLILSAFMLCDRKYALADYFNQQNIEIPDHPRYPTKGDGAPRVAPDAVPIDQEKPTPLEIDSSEPERDICGRDYVLQADFQTAHDALKSYAANWPEMMGPAAMAFNVVGWFRKASSRPQDGAPSLQNPNKEQNVEYVLGPVLLVWGNYILPVIFALLGTLVFVILDFYTKVRDSRLDPRDNWLGWVRLALGLVTGSCIGLFYSAAAPVNANPAQSVSAALSLSVSGIAFLAGFGVEGVFSMLQTLVTRVFVVSEEAPKQ
jgi:hypothetical protein